MKTYLKALGLGFLLVETGVANSLPPTPEKGEMSLYNSLPPTPEYKYSVTPYNSLPPTPEKGEMSLYNSLPPTPEKDKFFPMNTLSPMSQYRLKKELDWHNIYTAMNQHTRC